MTQDLSNYFHIIMLSIPMSPLLLLGHPKYRSKAVVPELGSHLGNSLRRKILRLNSRSSSPVMSPKNLYFNTSVVIRIYTFTAKASQSFHKSFTKLHFTGSFALASTTQSWCKEIFKSSGCRYKLNYLSLHPETSQGRDCYTCCGVAPRRNAVKVRIRLTAVYSFLSKKAEKAPGIYFACWKDGDHKPVRCIAFWFPQQRKAII